LHYDLFGKGGTETIIGLLGLVQGNGVTLLLATGVGWQQLALAVDCAVALQLHRLWLAVQHLDVVGRVIDGKLQTLSR